MICLDPFSIFPVYLVKVIENILDTVIDRKIQKRKYEEDKLDIFCTQTSSQ